MLAVFTRAVCAPVFSASSVVFRASSAAQRDRSGWLGRVAGDEKIYNQVAFEVMKELDVPINDLCAYVAEQQKKVPPRPLSELPTPPQRAKMRPGEIQQPFNVHFTPEGYDQLANLVAASVEKLLPATH